MSKTSPPSRDIQPLLILECKSIGFVIKLKEAVLDWQGSQRGDRRDT